MEMNERMLNFQAPQPAEKWTGIREAITDTGASYSNDFYLGRKLSGSEDCLVLNVYTPEVIFQRNIQFSAIS